MGAPVQISFPLSTSPGQDPQESGGRLINCFADPLGEAAAARQSWKRSPGLSLFAVVAGSGAFRGAILANNLIYVAIGTTVYSVAANGTVTTIGSLPGTGQVIFAHNEKSPTADIVAVTGNSAYLVLDSRQVQPNVCLPAFAISGGDSTATPSDQNAFDGSTTTEWLSSQMGASTDNKATPQQAISGGDLNGANIASNAFTGSGSVQWESQQQGNAAQGSAWLGQDFGLSPVDLTSITYFMPTANAVTSALVQYSDNNSTWVTLTTLSLTANALTTVGFASSGAAHRYWRLMANAAAPSSASWALNQVSFFDSGVSGVAWIGQNFGVGNAQTLVQMSVMQASAGLGNISSAIVEYSDNGSSWTSVGTFSLNAPGSFQTITWSAAGAHQWWRLRANANPGKGVRWGVYELQMMQAATTAPATVGSFPGGVLPSVNSVDFQDGYFFFMTGSKQIWASALNDIVINGLTFTTAQSRPAVSGMRVAAFKGVICAFTSSSCEIYQDTAQPFPNFPYSRLAVIDRGLLSTWALAGNTESFGELMWVGDDYGVYRFTGLFQPEKISPPQLDRLIEIQAKSDPTQLIAGCYVDGGRKMWTLSSPNWTWEFNVNTQKWNERASFSGGLLSRWRGMGGIDAFGYWIMGDAQTADLTYIDPTNYGELSGPQLYRIESGPAHRFPNRSRVGRLDIDFVVGVGQSASSSPNGQSPQVMISWSDDGGHTWQGPIMRSLGVQAQGTKRVWAASLGRTGPIGRRWRFDVSDPVYVGLIGAVMSETARLN